MDNCATFVINEGALNDDELIVAAQGYHIGNNKRYIYMVRYWTYANSWGNREHTFCATSIENAIKRYVKETDRLVEEDTFETLKYCAAEFRGESGL